MTVKTFFSPLRLPFSVPNFGLSAVVITLIKSVLRFVVLYMAGPVWYFISRGRIGLALGLFLISILFNKVGFLTSGLRYLTYLCIAGELIQLGMSLYVIWVRANRPAPTEYVEQVDIVDQNGQLLRRTQQPVDPETL